VQEVCHQSDQVETNQEMDLNVLILKE
jgi:hypothetical protein